MILNLAGLDRIPSFENFLYDYLVCPILALGRVTFGLIKGEGG